MKILRLATFSAFVSMVLLRAEADETAPLPTDDPKAVALRRVCEQGDLNAVKDQIAAGAPVDGPTSKYQFTALMEAADDGHLDILQYLISCHANVDLPDVQGSTALLHACSTDHAPCALALLDAGANPNLGSKWKRFPLMYAAQHGDDQIVAALIAHHAGVNATCNQGPAIWWSVGDNHFSTLKLLLEAGADANAPQKLQGNPHGQALPLLGFPASMGDTKTMEMILGHGYDINNPAIDGTTALIAAIMYRQPEAMNWLIARKASVNAQNKKGETALIVAVNYGSADTIRTLLDAGADPDLQDQTGRTALIWAARHAEEEMADVLVDHGAKVNLKDVKGETALTYAGNVGLTKLVDLLKSKGAERSDLHIIVDEQPTEALTSAQSWALGVGAIYAQTDGVNHGTLGRRSQDSGQAVATLRSYWGIRDRTSFFREFKWLVGSGHRARFQVEGARLANMPTIELALLEFYMAEISLFSPKAGDALRHMQNTLASYQKWGDRDGLAWDLCRAANLIRRGYDAHYLGEQEAWDNLMPVARQMQGKFSSWREMSDNFLDGREIWANQRDPRFEACSQLLLNPKDPNSPWNQNPWKTDLSGK